MLLLWSRRGERVKGEGGRRKEEGGRSVVVKRKRSKLVERAPCGL